MQLEELVPSLELCQRLKELGFPQVNRTFYWVFGLAGWEFVYHGDLSVPVNYITESHILAAPLADEILKYLPWKIENYRFQITKYAGVYYASYNGKIDGLAYGKSLKLADALSELLIWLIENGHVKIDTET